ncbi:MAG: YihY/virulence factor BrkB family protein [Chloroflexota bacterium]|nr:YihY/virulence factor BrkB family protein [Chloroflexota bacterium]
MSTRPARLGAPPPRPAAAVTKRALKAFSDDQMIQHAAAISFYSLMSLFPALLLAVSLLGIVGQYPETYDAIMGYLRDVAPPAAIVPLDASLRQALQNEGTATTAFVVSLVLALYGTTGVLEACRRGLNVVFEVERGRSFVRRKMIDVASTLVLMVLILTSLVLVFVGGGFAEDVASFIGLGPTVAAAWNVARWPAAVAVAILVFALIYYVTPDVHHRAFRWITPGAVVGVILWLAASFGFSAYVSNVGHIGAIYGTFAGAIVLVAWLFLTSVALLFGAELDAEIERQAELEEGVPRPETLNRPPKRG